MTRLETLRMIAAQLREDWLVVACNGMISRELYTIADRPNQFYMLGSMGLASSIGLGLALRRPARTVVVVDGDGNALMNLAALGNVAQLAPPNFYHLVIDNGVHGSTGGQRTISDAVAIEEVARACGYARVDRATDPQALSAGLSRCWSTPGPAMLLVKVEASANLHAIARVEIDPPALADRFRAVATGPA